MRLHQSIVIIIGTILIMALIASFPVWKHNKFHDLQKHRTQLIQSNRVLEGELQKKEFEINELSSRRRIETIASKLGLGFYTTYSALSN